jgi:4-amino-4-deoxy-L-arabinose transferase-like glycosyltransferase
MVFNPLGLLILIAIVAPWYAYAYALHGQDFIDGFIMRHNVQRFSGSLEGHGGSAFYYLIAVPLLLLPWSGLFFNALARIRRLA